MMIRNPHRTEPENTDGLNILFCFLMIIFLLVVYWPVRHFDYVNFDDDVYVTRNPIIQKGLSPEGIVAAFTTVHATYWIPLTWLSYMLDIALFGNDPGALHVTNLILHILNTLLVFYVFRKMTGEPFKSAAVAVLFGFHPLHVESVAWVTERKDVLSTFFLLNSLRAYIRYVAHPGSRRFLPVFVLFLMGIMAKPMVVTFPFALLLLDYWPLNRWQFNGSDKKKTVSDIVLAIKEKIPLFVIAFAASLLTFWLKQTGNAVRPSALYPLTLRIANALVSYVMYVGKMVWPFGLAIPYPYPMHIAGWKAASAFLFLAALTMVSIKSIKKYPFIAVGWFWYLGTMVPVIGIIQAGDQAMADRFAYIPFIGLYIILIWGGSKLAEGFRLKKTRLLAITSALFFCVLITTRVQLQYWENSAALFSHAVEVTENNYVAHHNLGVALAEDNRIKDAIGHYSEALKIQPLHLKTRINLGAAMMKQGKVMDAISQYREALQIMPQSAGAHYNMGNALVAIGRLDEAVSHYLEALKFDPDDADTHSNLGNVLMEQSRLDPAILHYREASRIDPDNPYRKNDLGAALMKIGNTESAESLFLEAIKLKSDFADAQNNLGVTLAKQSRIEEAIDCFKTALNINSEHVDANNNLKILIKNQKIAMER
jgi:protein O-mannosyl-transferase